jgi:hypothetical protein
LIDFLILFFILPFASAQEIPDYDKPYAPIFFDKPIYSWTDKIEIKIIAPSWNTDKYLIDSIGNNEQNPIKISTREYSLEQYRLTETDVKSGIFTGEIILTGFLHDANGDGNFDTNPRTIGNGPTSGFLQVERDSAVTVSFEFANGVVLTESVPVSWNLGTLKFTKDIFLSDDSVIIHIVDLDMNLNPEALDQIEIDIFSDSDVGGIKVNAIETSESSGFFIATISLSQTSASSGNRLYAQSGDKISAKYNDYTLPKPHSISDNLKIETMALIDSSVPAVERIQNSKITITDGFRNISPNLDVDNQLHIIGTVSNMQNFNQNFVYLFQIKNESNFVESISWVRGQLTSDQTFDVSQSWTPNKIGEYTIETFVWHTLNDPTPLSLVSTTKVTIGSLSG